MSLLLSPLSWLMLGSLMVILGLLSARGWLQVFGTAAGLLALAAMTPLVANLLVGAIERQATPDAGECDGVDAVVLLTGGIDREAQSKSDFGALTSTSLARLFVFLQQAEQSDPPLIIAGGGPYQVSESALMATLLNRLGPTRQPAQLEVHSQTTWESAGAVARMLPQRRVALASSALHLPRARRAFIAAGFEVCRVPLDRRHLSVSGLGALLPQSSSLRKTEAALHEMVGDLQYRWLASRHGAAEKPIPVQP